MMKKKSILVCRLIQKPEILNTQGTIITHSPMKCLNEATSEGAGLIVIIFSAGIISMRDQVIELCCCLKSNSLTKGIPVVVLIENLHRDMLIKLQEAGVESMVIYKTGVSIDLRYMADQVRTQDILIRIDLFLKKLCPFLNYIQIDNQHDLTVCRAYKNRMVLGGTRLHEVCETGDHLYCDCFLNPRTVS